MTVFQGGTVGSPIVISDDEDEEIVVLRHLFEIEDTPPGHYEENHDSYAPMTGTSTDFHAHGESFPIFSKKKIPSIAPPLDHITDTETGLL